MIMIETAAGKQPMNKQRLIQRAGLVALGAGAVVIAAWMSVAVWFPEARQYVDGWFAGMALSFGFCGIAWLVMSPWVSKEPLRPEMKRHFRSFFPAMVGYLLILPVVGLVQHELLPHWAFALVALLPVVPIGWVLVSIARYVRDSEELEQRIQLEAIALGCAATLLLTFVGGMLEMVDVLHLHMGLFWVFPIMSVTYGVAGWWRRRSYGLTGVC